MGPTENLLNPQGWAMECRINAEDPYNNFLPSVGTISTLIIPTGPGVRVDSGMFPGFEVTPYYDNMLAKIICWGENREEAVARMQRALGEMRVDGVKTTIPFHRQLIAHDSFRAGRITTRFVHDVLGY